MSQHGVKRVLVPRRVRITAGSLTAMVAVLALTVTLLPSGLKVVGAPGDAAATVTVDFGTAVQDVPASAFAGVISGYGQGHYITNDPTHQDNMRRLGLGLLRIELTYTEPGNPDSDVVCGGIGCHQDIPGEDWIAAIRELGAEPLLTLPLDGRHDASIDVADAVNMIGYLESHGTPVTQFVVGNETDSGGNDKNMSAAEYARRYLMIATAVRDAVPDAVIGGPAAAWNNTDYIRTFLQSAGDLVDFVDYHDYGQGGPEHSEEELLQGVVRGYATDIGAIRSLIEETVPDRADEIGIQIGEYNMDYGDPDGERQLTQLATVWTAGAVGTMLQAGATAMQYSDKNGSLGLTSEAGLGGIPVSEPLPVYHGIGMFTGEGLFRRFGSTMVQASSSDTALHVFASTDEKNVVIVNTATGAIDAALDLSGFGDGTGEVWQSTDAAAAPSSSGTVTIAAGSGEVSLPARSVTTLVLGDGSGADPTEPTTTAPDETSTTSSTTTATTAPPVDPDTTTPITVPPVDPGDGSTATQPGLLGEYFDNIDLTGTRRTRLDPDINFDFAEREPLYDEGIDDDTFSIRWTGELQVDTAGTYTLITTSDDGVRLWIDGNLVIDEWNDHTVRDDEVTLQLGAGRHTLRMAMYDNTHDAVARLSWIGPGITRQIIPTSNLFSEP